ncbi:organic solute transporter Ostalpha-domain-containing protein [Syncephalastrum racemosum]|uniref:Organic solute transporter Ostalpha-domain-containing protein n=1 Tax=Syncephalastrum racemosum TaxID=13706 RepID=A0A1X2HSH2_SYNRA|nr:organic solute transporter Ostalpha-domain-containing protein [Syncephalastrum racemosum]
MPLRLLWTEQSTVEGNYGDGGAGAELNPLAIHLALMFTLVGSCISMISVWLHWKNYRKPNQQRQVIRILWMVPIYGFSTYISLVSLNVAFYVDTFRDIYEAFVIYAFFQLLLNKLGGERALIIMLHSRPPTENFFPGTLWSREIDVGDPYTFLFVKRGIIQFVYVKPALAVLTMVLKATGNYQDGEISWSSAYMYLTFFYNLSVCLSLWCLMVFFYATKKDMTGFRPLPKFLCVKAIIFFSFWQSVIIALLVSVGAIPEGEGEEHISVAIQDFLICLEMVPAAIAHSYAFSYEDYYDPSVHSARMPVMVAVKDSFGIKDVIMDSLDAIRGNKFNYRSFEPSEGVPYIGSSRTSRIMAGLRYSTTTAKKHWLEPAPVSQYLSAGRGMNGEVVEEEYEPLEFPDPRQEDEVESLYEASRTMVFGDYNYPVIDFRAPLWRQARYPTPSTSSRSYGGTGQTPRNKKGKLRDPSYIAPREGCVDVIIEQGKGNYVVVHPDRSPPSSASPSPSTSSSSSPTPLPSKQLTPPQAHRTLPPRHRPAPPSSHPARPPQDSSAAESLRSSASTPLVPPVAAPPRPPTSTSLSSSSAQYTSFPQPQYSFSSPQPYDHSIDEEEQSLLTGNVWK